MRKAETYIRRSVRRRTKVRMLFRDIYIFNRRADDLQFRIEESQIQLAELQSNEVQNNASKTNLLQVCMCMIDSFLRLNLRKCKC